MPATAHHNWLDGDLQLPVRPCGNLRLVYANATATATANAIDHAIGYTHSDC
jgi:hypothetical protein